MVGMVVKEKVGELEEEVREVFYGRLRKDLTSGVQAVSRKRKLLMRFQDVCEQDLTLYELTAVTVENNPVDKEPVVTTIAVIPDNTVDAEKG